MSHWTMVRGSLFLRGARKLNIKDIKSIVGTPTKFYSKCVTDEEFEKAWKECTLPKGSEGSIQYSLDEKAGAINIYGNLRDYGKEEKDMNEIRSWFTDTVKKLKENSYFPESGFFQIGDSKDFIKEVIILDENRKCVSYNLTSIPRVLYGK